jgi:hypothetical protein
MPRNDLVDRLVTEEFGVFASDPLGYTADRERGIESLVNDGVDKKEALEVWTEFSRRFLTTGDGGTTLSAHGLDRARSLGENVAVDDETRAEIYEALRDADGTSNRKKLHEKVGASEDEFDQSLWTLRRRGIVETHTDVYTEEVTVSLTEPEKADSR